MKKLFFVLFLATVSMFLFIACGSGDILEENAPASAEPALQAVPVQLTVENIPQGLEPGEFLRGLGYYSFADYEILHWDERWYQADWVALRTNTAIQDFRIIELSHSYDASFDIICAIVEEKKDYQTHWK